MSAEQINASNRNVSLQPKKPYSTTSWLVQQKIGLQVYFVLLNNRKDCSDEIDLCETLLIQKCKKANENLLNIKKLAEKFTIKSFHGDTSRAKSDVIEFKKCLKI